MTWGTAPKSSALITTYVGVTTANWTVALSSVTPGNILVVYLLNTSGNANLPNLTTSGSPLTNPNGNLLAWSYRPSSFAVAIMAVPITVGMNQFNVTWGVGSGTLQAGYVYYEEWAGGPQGVTGPNFNNSYLVDVGATASSTASVTGSPGPMDTSTRNDLVLGICCQATNNGGIAATGVSGWTGTPTAGTVSFFGNLGSTFAGLSTSATTYQPSLNWTSSKAWASAAVSLKYGHQQDFFSALFT